jgi:hypothetical protein
MGSEAERRLLALARSLAALADDPGGLWAALAALSDQYRSDRALPGAVGRAWLKSRGDKTSALALAWAREQVRLALRDLVDRAPARTRGALAVDADTMAWLLLAACESLAQEPVSAVADRVRALFELTCHPAPPA